LQGWQALSKGFFQKMEKSSLTGFNVFPVSLKTKVTRGHLSEK
jgi:hypothetical protein